MIERELLRSSCFWCGLTGKSNYETKEWMGDEIDAFHGFSLVFRVVDVVFWIFPHIFHLTHQ